MTMTEPLVPETVATNASALADEQWRVAVLVGAIGARGRWDATLGTDARWRLARRGHFPQYASELDWTPREVVGHLRDSARIFTERLRRMTTEDTPRLPDFVTDDAVRIAGYRTTPVEVLADELRIAQADLLVTVAGLVEFLPAHQREHVEQLTALLGS